MALSLLLLCLFLSFWLVESYQKEKGNLRTQLDYEWTKARSFVQDSMLKEFLDSLDISFSPIPPRRPSADGDTLAFTPLKHGGSLIESINIAKQEFSGLSGQNAPFATIKIKSKDTLHTSSKNILTEYQLKKVSIPAVKENFIERIELKNLPQEHVFIAHDDTTNATIDMLYSIDDEIIIGNNTLAFKSNRGYLLKKIIPQIIFSLILLLIVGFSFWQSWRALKKQKHLGAMKSNFVSNMAHELKTPISTVSVAIEALQDFNVLEDKNKSKEYLDISKNELSRLTLLVDKVLKMSRFDNQKHILKKEEKIDFLEIIDTVSKSMKLQIEKYDAVYDLDLSKGNYNLKGDKIHITNVLYNLIDNALKYGGEKPKVIVKLESLIDKVILSVSDNGIGIPSEYQDQVFDRFFRVPQGNIHNTKGHGLGLSYARNVITAHGGKMYVESERGRGSKFTIEIPRND